MHDFEIEYDGDAVPSLDYAIFRIMGCYPEGTYGVFTGPTGRVRFSFFDVVDTLDEADIIKRELHDLSTTTGVSFRVFVGLVPEESRFDYE